jgi:hypothetical protein
MRVRDRVSGSRRRAGTRRWKLRASADGAVISVAAIIAPTVSSSSSSCGSSCSSKRVGQASDLRQTQMHAQDPAIVQHDLDQPGGAASAHSDLGLCRYRDRREAQPRQRTRATGGAKGEAGSGDRSWHTGVIQAA